jgi:putative NADH-flavin reductase
MKIGIIGANGKAGRIIAAEADRRGHEVTAIVRDREKILGPGYDILEKDLFDLTKNDLEAFDAVVSAYGLPFGGSHVNAYQKAFAYLTEVFEKLPKVRLLIVGGAASLFTDDTKQQKVLETIPELYRKDPQDMAIAFAALQKSNVNYTYFSPAVFFDPRGRRTGKYILGENDVVVKNLSGESYISYADYAVAMVDEIENSHHLCKRITAASDSKPVVREIPYYGILPAAPVFEGLSTYREPFSFELAGQKLRLQMDNGDRYFVDFLSGNTLMMAPLGTPSQVEHYECLKGGEGVYFVNFELTGIKPRTNLSLVIDVSERLVTLVKTVTDYDEKYPYLCDSEYFFGAIGEPGMSLPEKRHKFTTDLKGKRIHWHYSPTLEIIHVYYSTEYCRVTFPERTGWGDINPTEWQDMLMREPYDEKAAYIKIKDGLYLVSVLEQNMSRRGMTGNSLLFLIDTVRVHDVGRSFGHAGLQEGKIRPENYLYSAFGDFVYSDGVLESKPNVYVSGGTWRTK